MSTKIKLCGMMEPKDIEAANECKPDFVGFIFWDKSFRNLTEEQAKDLKEALDTNIKTVGVFVDADIQRIISLYKKGIIDIAQLHGVESEEYIAQIKKEGIPVIKAFVMPKTENPDREETARILKKASECSADYVLFDAGKGHGMTFNWEMLKGFDRTFFLAGGLSPENITDAIDSLHPYAVDVSSGIEINKSKSREKMMEFCNKVRK